MIGQKPFGIIIKQKSILLRKILLETSVEKGGELFGDKEHLFSIMQKNIPEASAKQLVKFEKFELDIKWTQMQNIEQIAIEEIKIQECRFFRSILV